MYYIPEDKRADKSANLLYDGLAECLKSKSLSDITVSDLNRKCGVSRSTFYRLFDTVDDILAWKCEQILKESIARANLAKNMPFKTSFMFFVSSWMENKDLLSAIIKNDRTDILYHVHGEYIDEMSDMFLNGSHPDDINKQYLAGLFAGMIPVGFQIWVKNPGCGPEDLYLQLKEALKIFSSVFE